MKTVQLPRFAGGLEVQNMWSTMMVRLWPRQSEEQSCHLLGKCTQRVRCPQRQKDET